MENKHTLDYRSSPSELTSRIQRLIFLWTPKGFISPEYFLNFFSNLYIPAWLPKTFKFMVLRLLENTFENQKIESVHFLSYFRANPHPSPSFLSSPIQTEKNHLFPRNNVFFKIYFPQQKGGGGSCMDLKKFPSVMVTSFDKFHNFCNVYVFGFFFVLP